MDRSAVIAAFLCLLAAEAYAQLVCYRCSDCGANLVDAVVCGGSGGGSGPTLPTTPAPTTTTQTRPSTISTIPPWPRQRSTARSSYVCYRIERWVPSQSRYVIDRGCALQLVSYETTCHSVTGFQGYQNCQFCINQLCN